MSLLANKETKTYKLNIIYNGLEYKGSQIQPIHDTIERSLTISVNKIYFCVVHIFLTCMSNFQKQNYPLSAQKKKVNNYINSSMKMFASKDVLLQSDTLMH